jgi:hypothetical protein
MTAISSAAWVVHDLGLATAVGGNIFGQASLEPALREVSDPVERDRVSANAWRRFSWIKLAAHAAFAVPWIIGRNLRTGREVGARARSLTRTKDLLIGLSLITGVVSHLIGLRLARRIERGEGPEESGDQRSRTLERSVTTLGTVNTLVNAGILGVTALLAMQASKSMRFAVSSRRLP